MQRIEDHRLSTWSRHSAYNSRSRVTDLFVVNLNYSIPTSFTTRRLGTGSFTSRLSRVRGTSGRVGPRNSPLRRSSKVALERQIAVCGCFPFFLSDVVFPGRSSLRRRSGGRRVATPGSPGSPHRSGTRPGTRRRTSDSACQREGNPPRQSTRNLRLNGYPSSPTDSAGQRPPPGPRSGLGKVPQRESLCPQRK